MRKSNQDLSLRILGYQVNFEPEIIDKTKHKDIEHYKFVRLRRTKLTRGAIRGGIKRGEG